MTDIDCAACGGTRINSNGGPCYPCQSRGLTAPRPRVDPASTMKVVQKIIEKVEAHTPPKPRGYEDDLSPFRAVAFDSCSGKAVMWGFCIERHLGEDRFNALARYGRLECIDHRGGPGAWALVTRALSRAEAAKLYGDITAEEFGPRGGWKSVTFGTTRFISRTMHPEALAIEPRAMRIDPGAEESLRELWDVPEGVDEALFAAGQAADPVVAESHLAEARELLTEDDIECDPLDF